MTLKLFSKSTISNVLRLLLRCGVGTLLRNVADLELWRVFGCLFGSLSPQRESKANLHSTNCAVAAGDL